MNLSFSNRQPTRPVDLRVLRRSVEALLQDVLQLREVDLGIRLVGAPEMVCLNETFLRHAGSTDVITFDYAEHAPGNAQRTIHGEIVVCVDEAVVQARRFRTTWQSEVHRYIVHGVLHLLGYTDTQPAARRRMKAAENRLVRRLAHDFMPRGSRRRAGA